MSITYRDPTASDAISEIVAAEGDLDLAAERLFGVPEPDKIHPKAQLISLISSDPFATAELQKQLRTLSLLQSFNSARLTGVTVDGALERLPASDRAKLYTQLLGVVASLTDDHATSINTNINSNSVNLTEVVLRQLPPQVQQAIKLLSAPTDPTAQPLSAGEDQSLFAAPRGLSPGSDDMVGGRARDAQNGHTAAYEILDHDQLLSDQPPNAAEGSTE